MKISIIIPVYNQEKYIEKCLNSILSNDFIGYEIIAIDDASTDNSLKILEKYKNIKIIKHKKNKYIGITRNDGLKAAKGEYVAFIDPDDYISKDFLSKMYENAKTNNSDLVICDYKYIYANNTEKDVLLPCFSTTNLKQNPKLIYDIPLGPCNKLFRRKMLVDNNINFTNLKYEDVSFVAECMMRSEIISKENSVLNYFRVHKMSETTTRDEKVFDIFKHMDYLKRILNDNEYIDDLITSILLNYAIQQRYQKDKNIRNKFIDQVFEYFVNNNIDFKNSIYIKERNIYKTIIEKNKNLIKIYCNIYQKLKRC